MTGEKYIQYRKTTVRSLSLFLPPTSVAARKEPEPMNTLQEDEPGELYRITSFIQTVVVVTKVCMVMSS